MSALLLAAVGGARVEAGVAPGKKEKKKSFFFRFFFKRE